MFESLRPHLVELRQRLVIIILTMVVLFVISFIYYSPILEWITQPLNDALNSVGNIMENAQEGKVTTHQVGGAFFVAMKVAFFSSLLLSMPVILWQIWKFVAPGLYEHEKRLVIPFVVGGSVMFALGILFAYYIVTPFGFEFLIAFGSENFIPYINIEDYLGFFMKILFGFGIAFELPIFIMFLAIMGLVTDKSLIDFFKYAVLIIFIFAAILTPPDVLTQMLMAIPLILLYTISIAIAKIINPYQEEE